MSGFCMSPEEFETFYITPRIFRFLTGFTKWIFEAVSLRYHTFLRFYIFEEKRVSNVIFISSTFYCKYLDDNNTNIFEKFQRII